LEDAGRKAFLIGAGYLHLAARLSQHRDFAETGRRLAGHGSALQTLAAGLASSGLDFVPGVGEFRVTVRAVRELRSRPFRRRRYLRGLKRLRHGEPDEAYRRMWRALGEEARRCFRAAYEVLHRDPRAFLRSLDDLLRTLTDWSQRSPTLREFAQEADLPGPARREPAGDDWTGALSSLLSWLWGEERR